MLGVTRNPPMIVTKFHPNGSLLNYLRKQQSIPMPTLLNFLKGVAAGMDHLEKEQIVHRDLAARNILVRTFLVAIDTYSLVLTWRPLYLILDLQELWESKKKGSQLAQLVLSGQMHIIPFIPHFCLDGWP